MIDHDIVYYIMIINKHYDAFWLTIILFISGKPDPPFELQIVDAGPSSIQLSWKPGFDGGSTQRFQVRYVESAEGAGYKYADVVPIEMNTYTIMGDYLIHIYIYDNDNDSDNIHYNNSILHEILCVIISQN